MRVFLAILCSLGMHLGGLFIFEGDGLLPSLALSPTSQVELTVQILPMRSSVPVQKLAAQEEKKVVQKTRAVAPSPLGKAKRAKLEYPHPKEKPASENAPQSEQPLRDEGRYESSLQPPRRQVTPAEYASNPPPVYPEISRRKHEEGTVLLLVLVDAEGRPEQVIVHQPAQYARLNEAAKAAVSRWRFAPASRRSLDGTVRHVSSQVVVPVTFSLSG